jgi:hypothetical protein
LLLSLLWVCAGCGSAASDGAGNDVRMGEWTGTTSDAQSLEFTVEELGVTRVAFGWVLPCPDGPEAFSVSTSAPQAIVRRELVIKDDVGMAADFTFIAAFDSDTTASGTLHIDAHAASGFCDGMSTVSFSASFSREPELE